MNSEKLQRKLADLGRTFSAWSIVVDVFNDKELVEIYSRGITKAQAALQEIADELNPKPHDTPYPENMCRVCGATLNALDAYVFGPIGRVCRGCFDEKMGPKPHDLVPAMREWEEAND